MAEVNDIESLPSQEQQESPKKEEPEIPTEVIEFSTLAKEDKLRYFNFFLANNTEFHKEKDGFYIAEIDVLGEEEIKPVDLDSNLQQSAASNKSPIKGAKKDYEAIYPKLLNTLGISTQLKGSKMKLFTLRALIQEIYALKFNKDTQILLSGEDAEPEDFPIFVANFLVEKYGRKKSLEKCVGDMILSIDYYSLTFKDIKVFQLFLSEEYDTDDLIYYLFLRSCIEKELQISFLEKAKESARVYQGYTGIDFEADSEDVLVPMESVRNVGLSVFGSGEKKMLEKFVAKAEELAAKGKGKKKSVGAGAILTMGVSDYHNSRANGQLDEDLKQPEPFEEKEEPMLSEKIVSKKEEVKSLEIEPPEEPRKEAVYKSQPASKITKSTKKNPGTSTGIKNQGLSSSVKPTVKVSTKSNTKNKSPLKAKNQNLKSSLVKKSVSPKKKVVTTSKKK